jgi:hypothetical protein
MHLFDPTPVTIAYPNWITRIMVLTIPLVTRIHMDRKHGPLKELMGRQGYLLSCFLHFDELDSVFMDGALVFAFPHAHDGVDALRL